MNSKTLATISELLEDFNAYPSKDTLAELRDWVTSRDQLDRVAELHPELRPVADRIGRKLFA